MYYLPTTILFILLAVAIFIYTIKNRKEKREKHNFNNEMLVGILFVMAGLLFPFMYISHSILPEGTLNFLWASTSIILTLEACTLSYILFGNMYKAKKHPERKFDYEKFCTEFRANWEYSFKKDVERKFLHLLPVGVIFFVWTLGMILDAFGVLAPMGLDVYSFAFWLIITVGYAFCVMFMFADLARLNRPDMLPDWAKAWFGKSMTVNELDTFISSAPLVLSFVPFLFAPFPIFAAVALITAVADAAASLVGKKYGKHKFNENSKKTIEGYLAGSSMTFLIVVLMTGIYQTYMPVTIAIVVTMAFVAAMIFLLVDATSEHITDNILNPILTGLGMWWIVLLFPF
jgi:dolichol kinase